MSEEFVECVSDAIADQNGRRDQERQPVILAQLDVKTVIRLGMHASLALQNGLRLLGGLFHQETHLRMTGRDVGRQTKFLAASRSWSALWTRSPCGARLAASSSLSCSCGRYAEQVRDLNRGGEHGDVGLGPRQSGALPRAAARHPPVDPIDKPAPASPSRLVREEHPGVRHSIYRIPALRFSVRSGLRARPAIRARYWARARSPSPEPSSHAARPAVSDLARPP